MNAADSTSLAFASHLYNLGEWLVIIGVVMEGIEIFWRHFHKDSFHGSVEPWLFSTVLKSEPIFIKRIGDMGWLILVVGLVLALLCHFHIHDLESRENNRLTSKLDDTTSKLHETTLKATLAQKDAAQSNERAAANELKAEKLRKENDWLAAYSNPRTVFAWPDNTILEKKSDFKVILLVAKDADDGQRLASDMEMFLFSPAGWSIIDRELLPSSGNSDGVEVYGLDGWPNIEIPDLTISERAAKSLVKHLADFGIAGRYISYPDNIAPPLKITQFPTNAIVVAVFKKPSPTKAKHMELFAQRDFLHMKIDDLSAKSEKLKNPIKIQDVRNQINQLEQEEENFDLDYGDDPYSPLPYPK
ncbi:MAG TPA: hypothetical protein VGO57_14615 [Verrucomicrobiae bacterium]|jgi:hypothetical protein